MRVSSPQTGVQYVSDWARATCSTTNPLHSELPGALFVDEGPVIELLRRLQAQGVLRTEADGRLHTVLAQP